MQTLVLRIPESLAHDLEAEAKRLKLTKSEVARQRLLHGSAGESSGTGFDLIADLIGSVKGGPADMSRRKKHYLKATGYGTSQHHR